MTTVQSPATEVLPDPDPTWIKHTPVVKSPGFLPHCTVLHKTDADNPYDKFVVHLAAYLAGKWTYARGDYYKTLEKALENDRLKGALS